MNAKILLGVTGGIAAFKSISVASGLTKLGADVRVAMTESATKFVSPMNFHEVTKNPVACSLWENLHPHIELAHFAELVVIAPATANFIAKTAHGIADDLLTSTMLALDSKTPVMIFPAMNTKMLDNPATQKNLETLRARGFHIIDPASGILACGDVGRGRLPEPADIIDAVQKFLESKQVLAGKTILITAGGTREKIDPVRFVSNRSTGKMGFALAEKSAERGADVILITAPTFLPDPASEKIQTIHVESAVEMHDAVLKHFETVDAVIMSAAVADFRPKKIFAEKFKKSADDPSETMSIELVRNPDILFELGQKKSHQILVGFAAETKDLEEYARDKIRRKNLDFIVANDVSRSDAGFAVDTNIVEIFFRDESKKSFPLMSKSELAGKILDELQKFF